jgi:hypothetical protein
VTPGLFGMLIAAGIAAGLAGSIAGLASLFSYPALLAMGLPATAANVTNTISLAVSSLSSVASSRPELVGQAPVLRRLAAICALGGAAGAGLLLMTPSGVFQRLVPFLVGGASIVLLARRKVSAELTAHASGRPSTSVLLGVLAVAVYGGYFGAAAGVLMLALLLAALPQSLIRINALKNVLLGLANVIAAIGFALFGPVAWFAALPLTMGLVLGNWVGPAVARRLPERALQIGIALAGLGLAVKLGLDAY